MKFRGEREQTCTMDMSYVFSHTLSFDVSHRQSFHPFFFRPFCFLSFSRQDKTHGDIEWDMCALCFLWDEGFLQWFSTLKKCECRDFLTQFFSFSSFPLQLIQIDVCASALSEVIPAVLEGSDGCLLAIGYPGAGEIHYEIILILSPPHCQVSAWLVNI